MRIRDENEILDPATRKAIIEEINGNENQERKQEAFRRYLIYKDDTKQFVIENLLKQFDKNTVNEMSYCIANISIVRKVIDKLARVYNQGVEREIEDDEQSEENLEVLEKELDFNTSMRKANKFLKLQKNIAFYIKPCEVGDKYKINLEPLNPYLYDAVENYYDRTKPMVFILSDFKYNPTTYTNSDAALSGRNIAVPAPKSNGKDDKIADSPQDAELGQMIWWSDSYHFTTDLKGNITSPDIENPIGEMPFVNFALDQDGQFWAQGGKDLIDGSILINSVITHNQHVGVTQGYGQFWMRGKNLPRNITIGPNKAILMEYDGAAGETAPDLGYATASPQLAELQSLSDGYIALLLTTNNLSTSAVASQLNGSNTSPSGIAMVIDKAESMEDVNDQRQIFIDNEPSIWRIINKWLNLYGDNLIDELKGLTLAENFEESFSISFKDAQVIVSEAERLQNLKLRKEIGLDSMIDLIKKDNPSLSDEQAKEKADSIAPQPHDEQTVDPNAPMQEAGAKLPAQTADVNIQKTALNGAQVTAMVDVVSKVALGLIPREAGIQIIYQAFNIDAAEAGRIMGNAGLGFKPEIMNEVKQPNSQQNQDGFNP